MSNEKKKERKGEKTKYINNENATISVCVCV